MVQRYKIKKVKTTLFLTSDAYRRCNFTYSMAGLEFDYANR